MTARAVLVIALLLIITRAIAVSTQSRITQGQYAAEGIAIDADLRAGEATFGTWLAGQIAAAGDSDITFADPATSDSPPVVPACSSCAWPGTVAFTITGQPSTSISAGQSQDDEAYNLQRADLVHENTVAVKIIATVTSANSGAAASRCELATYRISRQSPYTSTPVISNCGANVGVALERDAGGCDPSSVGSCDPTGGTQEAPTSTLVTAEKDCRGACTTETPQPANAYQNNNWQNGNASSSGWITH